MPRSWWLAAAALTLTSCGAGGPDSAPPTAPSSSSPTSSPSSSGSAAAADPVFNQAILHEVRLTMDPAEWQALRDNFRTNQYYAANMVIDGESIPQVGIRSRGAGSRNEVKPALKIDFNKYVPTQEFHGYKTMVLKNLYQDPTLMRERLAFLVFEAMGIPAPQNSHARLTVNDEYWGVYSLVESVTKPFLKARLGQESGNLFDYEYAFAWDFSWRGADGGSYVPVPFEPDTNEDSLDASGLVEFVRAINEAPDATFVRDISAFLDTQKFLTYVAVENALAETDGMVGEEGMNNFFLYQYGGQNRFIFIPWDKDHALSGMSWPVIDRMGANVLTRRLMADPAQVQLYLAAVRQAAGFVNDRWLVPRMETAYTQIRAAALADTKKQLSNDEFEQAIASLRNIITLQEAGVLQQLP